MRIKAFSTTPRRRTAAAATLLCAVTTTALLSASPASASDWGGDGDPTRCTDARTVASGEIMRNGVAVGLVEMRWSTMCSANWTRTTSYSGVHEITSFITVVATGRQAGAYDVYSGNWTPYLRVAPSERMCSEGDINLERPWTRVVCAS
jgi:hypothetical protein